MAHRELFQNLTIQGDKNVLELFRDGLNKVVLPADWHRNTDFESRWLEQLGREQRFVRVFAYCGNNHPRANVWLFGDDSEMHVGNIVPSETNKISPFEYNNIVRLFHTSVLRAFSENLTGLNIELGPDRESIEDLTTTRVLDALRSFSVHANKSTGNSHPYDNDRWRTFVIHAARDNCRLDSGFLSSWLIADGWSEEWADKLAKPVLGARNPARSTQKTT